MADSAAIRAALRARLLTVSGLPSDVAWEGAAYTPVRGTPWVREILSPGPEQLASLGPNALARMTGTLMLDLFVPPNLGTRTLDDLADAVLAVFPLGWQVVAGSSLVTITRVSRERVRAEPDWLFVPVTISWRADRTNTI